MTSNYMSFRMLTNLMIEGSMVIVNSVKAYEYFAKDFVDPQLLLYLDSSEIPDFFILPCY